jgi:hypothetical protein
MQEAPGNRQAEYALAHGLNNKLSVILGNCDLVLETIPAESPLLKRMTVIRETATSMAVELERFRNTLLAEPSGKRKKNIQRFRSHRLKK